MSISGTVKSYFSLFDNIRSPFLLLVLCERINYQFQSIDLGDEKDDSRKYASSGSFSSSFSSFSSFSVGSRFSCSQKNFNLSSMYFQILADIGKLCETLQRGDISDHREGNISIVIPAEQSVDATPRRDTPISALSASSDFSFISMNSNSTQSDSSETSPHQSNTQSSQPALAGVNYLSLIHI